MNFLNFYYNNIEKKQYFFNIGDSVTITYKLKDDKNLIIYHFNGVIIKKKNKGLLSSITVKKICINNINVFYTFFIFSPIICDIIKH